jgi:hypothetical protein
VTVREQLTAEIARLQTEDEAADWVHRNLPVKNTLLAADADIVEADSPAPQLIGTPRKRTISAREVTDGQEH